MRKFSKFLAALLLGGLLSACALPVHEQRYPWSDGWREGVVLRREAMPTGESGLLGPRCSARLREQGHAADRVVFEYTRMGQKRWWTLAVSSGTAWKAGDRALFNVRDCAKAPVRPAE